MVKTYLLKRLGIVAGKLYALPHVCRRVLSFDGLDVQIQHTYEHMFP